MASTASRCIAALALSLAGPAWSAGTLVGTVVRDHAQGSPVAAVQISARGANATQSGADGRFTLTFDRARPGDEVSVVIGGHDWAAVNAELLTVELPKAGAVMSVIVSRPAEVQLRRVDFFAQLATRAIDRSLRAQQDQARGRRGALKSKDRSRLDNGYEGALRQVPQWAARAASARPDPVNSLYARALRLVAEGHADEALELLSERRLRREAKAAQSAPDHNVRGWQLRALLLLVTRFDDETEPAIEAMEQATRLAPGSFEAWLGLASFRLYTIASAQVAYARALSIAREGARPAAVALALHTQGDHSRDAQRTGEARSQLEESLRIRRELARSMPAIHLPDVAATLADLGWVNLADNRPAEARAQLAEALQIRRTLARTEPAVHLPDVAACLRAMALLNHDEGRLAEARRQLEEALEIRRALAKAHPAAYLPELAATLYNAAALASDQNRTADAKAHHAEAWQIRLTLAGAGATAHLRARARTLLNDGSFEYGPAELRARREELLQLHRELAKSDPATYRVLTAVVLDRLGDQSRRAGRNADAKAQYEEALQIFRELPMPARANYLPDAARALGALGSLSHEAGRKADARVQLTEALKLYRRIGMPLPTLAATLTDLAVLNSEDKRDTEARSMYWEALQIYREHAGIEPFYLAHVARTLQLLASAAGTAEARTHYTEALQLYRELAKSDPQHLADTATVLGQLGRLNSIDNRRAEARAQYTEALQIHRDVAKAHPAALRDVALTLTELARVSSAEKRSAEARARYREALQIYRGLAKQSPGTLDDELRSVEAALESLAGQRK